MNTIYFTKVPKETVMVVMRTDTHIYGIKMWEILNSCVSWSYFWILTLPVPKLILLYHCLLYQMTRLPDPLP